LGWKRNQMTDALVRGEVDIVCCGAITSGLDVEINSPGKLKMFTTLDDSKGLPWNRLLVKNESSIFRLKDLENKKVTTFASSYAVPIFKKYLEQNSVDLSKVEIIPTTPQNQLAALESGSVDVMFANEPIPSIALSSGKYREIDNAIQHKQNPKSSAGAGFISTKFINQNPKLAKGVIKAIDQSHLWIQQNPEETKTLTGDWLKYDPKITYNLQLPTQFESTKVDLQKTQEFVDSLTELGIIKQNVNVSEMFYRAQ
jgi:ABC-type nitrate/sulfonate/bicarbonate transport system substrate-binding protein